MSALPCSLHSNQMLNHKHRENRRVCQDSKLLSGLAPNYLFAVEIPSLFSMFIFWFLTRQKLDKYFNTRRCDYFQEHSGPGAVPQLFTDDSGRLENFKAVTLILLFVAAPRMSSCPLCRRLLFRNHLQSHLQATCSPDVTASSVSVLSYVVLFLETRPK